MNICYKFGNNVKKYRQQKGFTQEKLSELSGLSRNYISDVELGKRSISLKNIEIIAISLEIEVQYLFIFD